MTPEDIAKEVRRGRIMAALELARDAISIALRDWDPMTDAQQKRHIVAMVATRSVLRQMVERAQTDGKTESPDDIAQLRHHVATHRATCANSCALIERMIEEHEAMRQVITAACEQADSSTGLKAFDNLEKAVERYLSRAVVP